MLRTIKAEPTLWDAILPECCRGLPAGLAEVDGLLDDVRFFEPARMAVLAAIATATASEARVVAINARRALGRRGVAAEGKLAAMRSSTM